MNTEAGVEESTRERVLRLHPTLNLGAFIELSPAADNDFCLIDLAGDLPQTLTYGEFREKVARSAGAFRELGLGFGDKIALCLPNSAAFAISFLGLMRIGAVPVLANPQTTRDVLRFVIADSKCVGVLTDTIAYPGLAQVADEKQLAVRIGAAAAPRGWLRLDQLLDGASPDSLVHPMEFQDQAFQPYTAGSTGEPKGIVLTHGGMLWGIEHSQRYWPGSPAERGIIAAPMYHKNALRGTLKPMLRCGASTVILKRFEARQYLAALAQYQVTSCAGVPAMFAAILGHRDLLKSLDFSNLRYVSLGSSVVPEELLRELGVAFPTANIKESYGLTEGGGPLRPPLDQRATPVGSVGVQVPEVEVKLVGSGGDTSEGELWIRSPYVLKDYANRPDLTAQKIVDGWLRTGDLFRVDESGFYYYLARTDDMFVCGGENIYPKEVENLLLSHPDVRDALVVPLPHETKGFAPAAIVVSRAGSAPEPDELRDFCAREGAAYAIPRVILTATAIPLTTAGKPDRAEAAKLLVKAFGPILAASRRARPGQDRTIA